MLTLSFASHLFAGELTFPVVDTSQDTCYNNSSATTPPTPGESFYGQDAQYQGNQPSYTNNEDGTITDNVTGLMWQKDFTKVQWALAQSEADAADTGQYNDWRVPTIKELYSLIDFTGSQGSGLPTSPTPPADALPFIDTDYFEFEYPSTGRYIDAQYVSSTEYTSTTMNGNDTFFGVNFADGRIKGYPKVNNNHPEYYARYVRGNISYGKNDFVNNGDGTITDIATGLMWAKNDSGYGMVWQDSLAYAEDLILADYDDWRLPNAKELHTIVDYTRSPDATGSAAIDAGFDTTSIRNELNQDDYPFFWSSTTFTRPSSDAIMICFGRAMGYMNNQFMDVHGAGCQRTDPKTGTPSYGHGPQGDVRRVYNYIRAVRTVNCGEPGYVTDLDGDLNADCYVNLLDLAELAKEWQLQYEYEELASIAKMWLDCNDPQAPCNY